jgi:hypothetical protein
LPAGPLAQGKIMARNGSLLLLAFLFAATSALAQQTGSKAVPRGVILVKGATPSASDATTPVPEGTAVAAGRLESRYFGMAYGLPAGWIEQVKGPPPSDSGNYVLALLVPSDAMSKSVRGSILIQAQDLFFTAPPAANALQMVRYVRDHLPPAQQVVRAPAEVKLGDRTFARLDYAAPDIGLHWHIVATDIRCHTVQFIFSGADPEMLDAMIAGLSRLDLPGGGRAPLCVAGYAAPENVIEHVDPVFPTHRFNAVPTRIIIDRQGRVKHVHVISAFPEQSAALTAALMKWRFKPYLKNGKAVEIETGIMFGSNGR